MSTEETTPCGSCGKDVDVLERFPGALCLVCYAKTPQGRRMPTADELRRMWSA